jgi:hypothetical protein
MKYASTIIHPVAKLIDLGKNSRGVGDLARGIGHRRHQLAVNIANRQQQGSANRESQNTAQRPPAQQPVVHDNQPAHAHHGSPTQGEVIDHAKFARKCSHGSVAIGN